MCQKVKILLLAMCTILPVSPKIWKNCDRLLYNYSEIFYSNLYRSYTYTCYYVFLCFIFYTMMYVRMYDILLMGL